MPPGEDPLLDEVRAFLRAESTTRRLWRRRAWLGRRAAFTRLEAVVLARWRSNMRNADDERHAFVSAMLDALEAIGALDIVSAGRWAEGLDDPTAATRAVEIWGGQKPPANAADYVARLAGKVNKRPGRNVTPDR